MLQKKSQSRDLCTTYGKEEVQAEEDISASGIRNQKASSSHAKEALDDIVNTADGQSLADNEDAEWDIKPIYILQYYSAGAGSTKFHR